jgi:hypothetical protein
VGRSTRHQAIEQSCGFEQGIIRLAINHLLSTARVILHGLIGEGSGS